VLIIVWILVGISNLGKLNTAAMVLLFILTIILCKLIFFKDTADFIPKDSISFGAAVELAAAMPLSWLPLISDYTREAQKPFQATLASTVVYGLVSCWMYAIGMGAAIYTVEFNIANIMVKAGLGIAGLLIIIFSTVTTTFLDAFSAGVSAESISKKLNSKWAAVIVTVIGAIGAMLYPMDNIMGFLYLIGSVFAPMIAIQIADYFILKKDWMNSKVNPINLLIWLAGFLIYRLLMNVNTIVGNTLPDMVVTIIICVLANKIAGITKYKEK
jgi:putative hydroxymethylpyrimidine transporter CytX